MWLEIVCAVHKIRLFIVHAKIKGLIVCAVHKIRLFTVHAKIIPGNLSHVSHYVTLNYN